MQLINMQHHSSGSIPTFILRGLLFPGRNPLHRRLRHGGKATDDESINNDIGCSRNSRSRLPCPINRVSVLPQWTLIF